MDLVSFSSINVSDPVVDGRRAWSTVCLKRRDGEEHSFKLMARYQETLDERDAGLLRMAMAMPLMNYGLFSDEIILDFPLCRSDLRLMEDLLETFSRDIFVNKLARKRTAHIIPGYVPDEADITLENARPRARLSCASIQDDASTASVSGEACGVLSSGGKESLLTYGMLKELDADVHPLYVVESGGHWRTALTAYRHHEKTDANTGRVWSNVDRFYNFMLDNLHFIRKDHRKVWADTYPIRLCIFPFYIFLLLPVFARRGISNVLLGSEFDDVRETPVYKGIPHHYGVYDQTQEFDMRMENWYSTRLPGMRQWSAVRPISGLIVQRILVQRYPELAGLQRSCHSCRMQDGGIVPCGKCSKCLGVMLFITASGLKPDMMNFRKEDVEAFPGRLAKGGLKLDEEEREHSIHLAGPGVGSGVRHPHVESVHLHPPISDPCLIPEEYREGLLKIIGEYSNGYVVLKGGQWSLSVKEPGP